MIKPSKSQITKWVKKNFGTDFKEAKQGKELRINNPMSIDDGYHLWINLEKAIVNDFRPTYKDDVRGTFLSFVMKYKKISFRQAVKEVMGNVKIDELRHSIYDKDEEEEEKVRVELPNDFKYLTYDDTIISKIIKTYLNNRCIANGKAYKVGIGYSGMNVLFPYRENNEIVYWQQRSVNNKRFLYPSDTNKSDFIYGIDEIDPTEPVIVTESIFNSLMFDNSIAVGGSDLSDTQKNKLKKSGAKKVIMAFDNDDAGLSGTAKAYNKLSAYFELYCTFTNDDRDWNDLAIDDGKNEMMKVFKNNISKLDFAKCIKLKRQKPTIS
jgi:hypothetical protein